MAALSHLRHLNHTQRVHHIVLGATSEAMPTDPLGSMHHGATGMMPITILLLMVYRMVLT